MALTVGSPTALPINSVPTVRMTITTVTPDTSYPTNGWALSAANLGLSRVGNAIVQVAGGSSNNTATSGSYDVANSKLKMYANTDAAGCPLAEVANTTNLSGLTVTVFAFGV